MDFQKRGVMKSQIRLKRAYNAAKDDDGCRILVDRMWPRGISKDKAKIDYWAKQIAPSDELRKWYGHDPAKWERFKEQYFKELDANPEALNELMVYICQQETATFVFSSKEEEFNNAAALKEYVDQFAEC